MALLILVALITAYALVLTVMHIKLRDEVREIKENNRTQEKKINTLNYKVKYLEWKLTNMINTESADQMKLQKEKARLMAINDRLMERIKRTLPL